MNVSLQIISKSIIIFVIKKLPKHNDYRYKIVDSVTNKESKIIIAKKK